MGHTRAPHTRVPHTRVSADRVPTRGVHLDFSEMGVSSHEKRPLTANKNHAIPGSARRFSAIGRAGDAFRLDASAAHKLRAVLRLNIGDTIAIADEHGIEHACTLISLDDDGAAATPIEGISRPLVEPAPVTIGVAVIKGERMDWAVEKVGEAGAAHLLPIISDRCAVRDVSQARLDRWRRISSAAALQSGRSRPTEILNPEPNLASALAPYNSAWHCDSRGRSVIAIMTDRTRGTCEVPPLILIGPEGGWSPSELHTLSLKSQPVSLGNLTLRTETACAIATNTIFQMISIDLK